MIKIFNCFMNIYHRNNDIRFFYVNSLKLASKGYHNVDMSIPDKDTYEKFKDYFKNHRYVADVKDAGVDTLIGAQGIFDLVKGGFNKAVEDFESLGVEEIRDIPNGKKIVPADITWKRPAYGLDPREYDNLIGKIAGQQIKEDSVLNWSMLSTDRK